MLVVMTENVEVECNIHGHYAIIIDWDYSFSDMLLRL